MSDSVQPHRQQPTRLLCLWDSPGKNTGVGCHFLFQCMIVKSASKVAQSCLILSGPMDCSPPGSSVHGIFQASVLEWDAIAFYAICGWGTLKKTFLWQVWLTLYYHLCIDSAGEGGCAVYVSKKTSLCLVGTRNWLSCRMLTIAASVTDVLLFRDLFCGI